jgi:hypothetical protein
MLFAENTTVKITQPLPSKILHFDGENKEESYFKL